MARILYGHGRGVGGHILGAHGAGGKTAEQMIADESAFGSMMVAGNWYDNAGRTMFDSTQLTSWQSTTGETMVLPSLLYSGDDMSPRPTYDESRGVLFEVQNGFDLADGLLSQTDNFGIIMTLDFDPASHPTYTTKANLDSAVSGGTIDRGAIAVVTGDTNTTFSPDVERVVGIQFSDTQLVNGRYVHYYNALSNPVNHELFSIKGPGGQYIEIRVDRLGRVLAVLYDGAVGVTCQSFGNQVVGLTGKHIVALLKDASQMRLFIDGIEVGAVPSTASSVTTLNSMLFNGNSRSGSTLLPVMGFRFYCRNFALFENWTWSDFVLAHNTIADYAGCPKLSFGNVYGWLAAGQSWWQGSITVTDTWTTDSGWDGQVDRSQGTRDSDHKLLTHDLIEKVYAAQSQNENSKIGPLSLAITGSGTVAANGSYKIGDAEGYAWGAFSQLAAAGTAVWGIASAGAGGAQLATLAARTSPAIPLEDLDTKTAAEITYAEKLLQSVLYQRDFWSARGKTYEAKVFFWQQGHSDPSTASYVSDFLAYYDDINSDVKELTGQTDDVICLIPQVNYSVNGETNRGILPTQIDQQILDIVENRGSRPIYCIGPMYQITNFIHSYLAGHRWIGEIVGKVAGRIVFDGEAWAPLTATSVSYSGSDIDVTLNVPVGPLQFQTNNNNVDATVAFDGVNTYGFSVHSGDPLTATVTIASPGVFSATAHGLSDDDTVVLATLGALPTGLSQRTKYFVVNSTANTFELSATQGGSAINTSGTQSGTHYVYKIKSISSVSITDTGVDGTGVVRIALSETAAAGDVVQYTGWVSRFGNLCDSDAHTALYRDQDWTQTFVSGSPPTAEGELNDLRNWCCAFSMALS